MQYIKEAQIAVVFFKPSSFPDQFKPVKSTAGSMKGSITDSSSHRDLSLEIVLS